MAEHVNGCCYCGTIQFQAELPPRWVAHCHCQTCREAHGAAFVTWVGFLQSKLQITAGHNLLHRYKTDTGATRSFCATCGSTIFYEHPTRFPGEIHVTLANLKWSPTLSPIENVNLDEQVIWAQPHK